MQVEVEGELVKRFRRRTGSVFHSPPRLSVRERGILYFAVGAMIPVTWFNGGGFLFAQQLGLVMAVLAFVWVLLPLPGGLGEGRDWERRRAVHRLLRFPLFWLGGLFLLYVAIQGWNPHLAFMQDAAGWWIVRQESVAWLPAGMDAPIERMNTWREWIVMATLFLWANTLWAGLYHRRALRLLLWLVAANAFIWAVVAIYQELRGAESMLGYFSPERVAKYWRGPGGTVIRDVSFWGAMINVNHASAFLNVGAVANLFLFFLYMEFSEKRLVKSGPHLLFAFSAVFILAASFLSYSRAGMVIALGLPVMAVVGYGVMLLARAEKERFLWFFGFAGIVLIAGGGILVSLVDTGRLQLEVERTKRTLAAPREDIRFDLQAATVEMFTDKWVYGWGAGSFRYVFPFYQKNYESLNRRVSVGRYNYATERWERSSKRLFFRYAHNDYLQMLAELGVVGTVLFALIIASFGALLWARRRFWSLSTGMLFVGLLFVMTHSTVDFLFAVPAVMWTVVVLGLCGLLYMDLKLEREASRELKTEAG